MLCNKELRFPFQQIFLEYSPMHGGRLLSLFCSSFPKDSWFMPKQVTPLSSHLLKKPQSIFRRNRLAASRGFELSKTLKNCRLYKCKPKVLSKLPNRAGTYVLTLPRQGYLGQDWLKIEKRVIVNQQLIFFEERSLSRGSSNVIDLPTGYMQCVSLLGVGALSKQTQTFSVSKH